MSDSHPGSAGHHGDADAPGWPARAWGLALLGILSGLAIHFLNESDPNPAHADAVSLRVAVATLVGVASLVFAVIVERTRLAVSLGFAVVCGAIVGMTMYLNGPLSWRGPSEQIWRIVCALLFVVIAAPLFQSWRGNRGEAASRFGIPYPAAYDHAWTNVVLGFAALIFTGIMWLMAILLGQLFKLIGISALQTLLSKEWMVLALTGAALGASIALLRDRENILSLLRRVVTTVESVLAPVLAFGLIAFLVAIPFTGLAPLWQATKSTTPILLGCIIGALCLINAVLGETEEQASRNRILRASVLALSLAMLPFAVIAAVSTGSRIQQYGLTPDRLWAVVFTAIACAYALAYFVALVRARAALGPHLRSANLLLSLGLCVLALILSTPLVNFSAMSAADQVARLENGTTPADKFDWAALRFDYGKPGMAATQRLAKQGASKAIRDQAAKALKATVRWELSNDDRAIEPTPLDEKALVILPRRIALPPKLLDVLAKDLTCMGDEVCTVIHEAGSDEAVVVQRTRVSLWIRQGSAWSKAYQPTPYYEDDQVQQFKRNLAAGQYEVRTITSRQLYIGGQPVGDPFPAKAR